MTKLKRTKLKLSAAIGTTLIVGLTAIVSFAGAFSNKSPQAPANIVEHADNVTVNQASSPESSSDNLDQSLGAVTSPDLKNPYLCVNGDCRYSLVQSFIDASTTIVSISDPFLAATSSASDIVLVDNGNGTGLTGATSTIDSLRLNITGAATTTYSIGCATSGVPYSTSSASVVLMDTLNTVSSTMGNTNFVIETGTASSTTGSYDPVQYDSSFATLVKFSSKVMLTPIRPYLVCKVFPADANAFTNNGNTFDGKVLLRVSRIR